MPPANTAANPEHLVEAAATQTKEIVNQALSDLTTAATSDDTRDKFFPNGIELIHFKLDVGPEGVSIDLQIAGGGGKAPRELELTPLDETEEEELLEEEDAQELEPDEPLLES